MTTYNAFVSYLADRQTDRQCKHTEYHNTHQFVHGYNAL